MGQILVVKPLLCCLYMYTTFMLRGVVLSRVSLINGMEYGLEQWNGIVECANRKTVLNEKLYGKQKHLRCKKVAWPRKTATKRGDMRVWPR